MRARTATVSALALALGLAAAATAQARTTTSQKGKVSVDLPDSWKVQSLQPDVMLLAADATDEVGLLFWVVDEGDVGKAAKLLDAQIGKFAQDVKWSNKPKQVTINGMQGLAMDGTATTGGQPIVTAVLVLRTPSGKGLITLVMAKASAKEAHGAEVKAILNSLRPAK